MVIFKWAFVYIKVLKHPCQPVCFNHSLLWALKWKTTWIFLHIFNHVLLAFIKELLTIHRTHLRLWNFCSSSLEMIDNIFTLNIVIIHSQTLRRKFSRVEGRTDNRISPESLLCLSTSVTASPRKPWGRGMSEPNKIPEVKVIF